MMTHKNVQLKESRANKLLYKLFEEAFDVILQGFYTTSKATTATDNTNNTDDERRPSWPPATPTTSRDACIRALKGLAVESGMDSRNVHMVRCTIVRCSLCPM